MSNKQHDKKSIKVVSLGDFITFNFANKSDFDETLLQNDVEKL